MSISQFKDYIINGGFDYIFDAPMDKFTTLHIGGNADILVQPSNVEQLVQLISVAKNFNAPVTFIGNGSNLLVCDKGIRGAVIKFGCNFSQASVDGNVITAQSGISLARLAQVALDNSLTGFEFASGIPGTLGGGIVMNAGAYKGELKDVVISVTALLEDGTVKTFEKEELDFSYRHSVFTGTKMLVLSADILLEKGDATLIKDRMNELAAKRRSTQPLEFPSAGSAFKRPKVGYAAALIDSCGLKGFAVGDAQVSEKHAGFIINKGNASAQNMLDLLDYVQKKVLKENGTFLEPEVVIIGER